MRYFITDLVVVVVVVVVEVVVDSVEVVVSSGFVVVLVDVPVVVSVIRAGQLTDLESFRGGHGIEVIFKMNEYFV